MIILNNISKSTPEKPLFSGLSLTLNAGDRLGIVGQNGCGKSTLFKIIAGVESFDTGSIDRGQEKIMLAPQHLDVSPGTTIDDYLNPTDNLDVWRYLSELHLIDIPLETPIAHLSGGQKTKLLLIHTFSTPSTALLLDEPTNHLDQETREWLTAQVLAYPGILVTISHDRTFLNACTTEILEIDPTNQQTMLFQGNYDAYKKAKAAWMARRDEEYRLQQRKKRQMKEWIDLKRQEASVYDSPAKGRQLRQMEKRFEREILAVEIWKPKDEKGMSRSGFSGEVHTGKLMLRLQEVSKAYEGIPVLENVSFELRGQTHARLTGPNGSGKSTLLKMILGNFPPDSGSIEIGNNVRVGYFSQEFDTLSPNATVLETFMSIPGRPMSEGRARTVLGSLLFSGDSVTKRIRNLSYGERVRLQIAIILGEEHELLILDEPTNHLDIPSREIIEEALQTYKGALLIVSHDEYFLKAIGIDTAINLLP